MSGDPPVVKLDRRKTGGCRAGRTTFVYRLPARLHPDILPFIQHLGRLTLPFGRTRMLRLECDGYVVTGISKMREVRASLGKDSSEDVLEPFEEALRKWMDSIED